MGIDRIGAEPVVANTVPAAGIGLKFISPFRVFREAYRPSVAYNIFLETVVAVEMDKFETGRFGLISENWSLGPGHPGTDQQHQNLSR